MVPSAKLWTKRVMEHLKEQVHWVGGVLIGGPDETGEMKLFKYVLMPSGRYRKLTGTQRVGRMRWEGPRVL